MRKRNLFIFLLVFTLFLSACNFPLSSETETEEAINEADLMSTAVAGTVQAMSLSAQPTAEPTQPPPAEAAVEAVQPTLTLQPTIAVAAPPTTPPQACNQAEFVSETIPDDTMFSLGEAFTKTWTFRNTGTCTWNTEYQLVFVTGDWMEGAPGVKLTKSVAPQETVTISVPLRAPWAEGTYTGYWSLQGDDGVIFLSNNSVRIKASSSAFQVTSVTTDLIDRSPNCPYDYYYSVDITTSSAGTVSFHTIDSLGDTGSIKKIKFDSAGTKDKDLLMEITATGEYWVKIHIDEPNNQTFGPFKFDITCP